MDDVIRILTGDCRDVLKTLPDASVQCCVTSPPYYGLRDYGTAQWEGGDAQCDHKGAALASSSSTLAGYTSENVKIRLDGGVPFRDVCGKCGARRIDSQIGLEQTPAEYVAQLVEVFREVRRVLRDDGTLWLNLGDSYNGYYANQYATSLSARNQQARQVVESGAGLRVSSLKPKDLIGIPWMVAFALREDGWWLRQDNIWAKRNCMPESVRDRTTRAHEYVFMLTKSERYFYDAVAIEEEGEIAAGTRAAKGSVERAEQANGRPPEYAVYTGRRNKRSVWWVATQPFPEAHFATFPPDLIEPCILAGTSEKGCCSACGAPWVRQTEKQTAFTSGSGRAGNTPVGKYEGTEQAVSGTYDVRMGPSVTTITTGWTPSCRCNAGVVPCTVIDPFGGAGTSALVADRLGRGAVIIELNPSYAEMARNRVVRDAGLFAEVAK